MGTAVGTCIMSRCRAAQVPPFGGGEVTVRESFAIQ